MLQSTSLHKLTTGSASTVETPSPDQEVQDFIGRRTLANPSGTISLPPNLAVDLETLSPNMSPKLKARAIKALEAFAEAATKQDPNAAAKATQELAAVIAAAQQEQEESLKAAGLGDDVWIAKLPHAIRGAYLQKSAAIEEAERDGDARRVALLKSELRALVPQARAIQQDAAVVDVFRAALAVRRGANEMMRP